jgi:benzylsuccinate CoA-transferase BbsE subunit
MLPLDGVRVLEIGGGVPAAFATRWFAGYGAEVARSEGPDGALDADEEVALLPGKRRISVGDAQLRALALAADVVIEDGKPGALAARSLDPLELRKQKPALVVTSLTPHGQTGPRAHHEATNLTAHAAGGILSLTGVQGRPPLANGANQALKLLGLEGFAASITAWLGAQLHGEGDWIDLSAQECAASMLEFHGPRSAVDGLPAPRLGNRTTAIWALYRCADGYAGVCSLQRQARALLEGMGDPDLLQPRFLDPMERMKDDKELGRRVERFFSDKTRTDLLALGLKQKVPFGAVMTPRELLDSKALRERGFFDEVTTPYGVGRIPGRPFVGLPWRPGTLSAPAADTAAVLHDWLGEA